MKRTTGQPESSVTVMEEEPWYAPRARELREAEASRIAERNEVQRVAEERNRELVAAIPGWWPAFAREWRTVGEVLGVAAAGPLPPWETARTLTEGTRCTLAGERGTVEVRLSDEGALLAHRLTFGSGYTIEIPLTPTADGITPSPADAVRLCLEGWIERTAGQRRIT